MDLKSLYCHTHLSAGLRANEASDGTEVVVVSANEDAEKGGLCTTPVHALRRIGDLQFHRSLAAGIRLYTRTNVKTYTECFKSNEMCETMCVIKPLRFQELTFFNSNSSSRSRNTRKSQMSLLMQ